jgi:hypothetical protein
MNIRDMGEGNRKINCSMLEEKYIILLAPIRHFDCGLTILTILCGIAIYLCRCTHVSNNLEGKN